MPKNIVAKATFIAVACSLAMSAHAVADSPRNLNVPAGDLIEALRSLATQSDVQLMYQPEQLRDFHTEGVKGEYSPQQAVAILLKGTSLHVRTDSSGAMVIVPAVAQGTGTSSGAAADRAPTESSPAKDNQEVESENRSFWDRFRVAQVDPRVSVSADSNGGSTDVGQPVRLEEVLVTAQKRAEKLQDVPVSIAVIENQDIERRGLIGMQDYLRSVPGVNQIDGGAISNAIVIRGITTSPTAENFYSGTTVATYFDETPITGAGGWGASGIDVRPVDIDRIEVLRGPQGTAYGNASLSGTVRLIPAKPKLDAFSARVAGSFAETAVEGGDNTMAQGTVNIPLLADRFAIRAVGYRYDESGYYRNIGGADPATRAIAENAGLGTYLDGFAQNDVGRMLTTGGRLAALWKPAETISLSANFLTQRIEQDGMPQAQVGRFDQARIPIAPQARVRGQAGEMAGTSIHLSNLVLEDDVGFGTLTAAASYIDSGSVSAGDLSRFYGFPASTANPSEFRSVTGEVRFASRFAGPLQFLGGIYYEDIDEHFLQTGDWPGAPAASPFGTNPMLLADFTRGLTQRAVFGELSYALTNALTATVGGRYFRYSKNETDLYEGGLYGVPIGSGVPTDLRSKEGNTSYKANLTFKPHDDALVYASWAQGFRLGRPSTGLPSITCDQDNNGLLDGTDVSIASTRRVDSDFLDNYEVGGKFAFMDRRVIIDSAVYYIKWEGLPISTFANACNLPYTANVGGATSRGIELQASWLATKAVRIDIGAGYTDPELSKPGLGAPKGTRLPGSPKLNANLSAQYDFNVHGYKSFVRADSMYSGAFYGDLLQTPSLEAGNYVKVDARAGVLIDSLSIELFVRNLTNRDAYTFRGVFPDTPLFGYRLQPRTVGLQLGYSFE